ncbi:transcription initiation factor TFIID subunit 11-like, partial [Diaphorina citri]|uniref:Transcription initiation factor TFIID subunit 11-like n=1 Tax=Diaphorina citri TaxID=121845 RepID=A0A1S3DRS7_DIACI
SKPGTKVPEAKSRSLYDSFFSTPQKTEPPSKPLTRVPSKDERDNDARMGTKNAQLTRNQGNDPCQSSKSGTKVPEAKSSLFDSFFSTPQKTEPPSKLLTRVPSKDERDNDARMGTKNAQLTRNQGNKTPNKTIPKSDAKSKRRAVPDDIADLLDQIPDVKSSAKKAKNNDEDDEDDFSDIDKVKRKPGKRDPFLDAENEDEGTIAEVPPKPEDKELAKTNPKEMKQQDFVKSNTPTGSHEVEKQDDDDSDMLKDIDKPKTLGARAVDVPNDNGK